LIRIHFVGHIRTEVGAEEITVEDDELDSIALIHRLRAMSNEPGFDEFNTLVMVEDSEAFVPAKSGRKLKHGDNVVLIPFSHGG
jgi:molybdopterin converting factor small subunit